MKRLVLSAMLATAALSTGCRELSSSGTDSYGEATTPTPTSSWTNAKARFSERQHQAVLFARKCRSDPSLFLSSCENTVRSLTSLSDRGEIVQNSGEAALRRNDGKRLGQAIEDLDGVGKQMTNTVEGFRH